VSTPPSEDCTSWVRLIETITRQSDARSKQLIPTTKFHQLLEAHAEQVKRTFDKHFLLIEK
jgi:hypothetical protein